MKYYIGIDLGGTNIVAGVVNEAYEILAKASVKTNLPRPEQEIAADMAKVAKEAAEKAGLTMDQIEWVGIGTPGIANSETGIIEYSNNLGFVNTPMVKYMEDALGKKAFIENDANAALLPSASILQAVQRVQKMQSALHWALVLVAVSSLTARFTVAQTSAVLKSVTL